MEEPKQEFSPEARREILELARAALEAAVNREEPPAAEPGSEALNLERGIFVTLKNSGMLRGCLGRFSADVPLWKLVPEMTAASATQDPRFFNNPITPQELLGISINISVLSPLREVSSPEEVRVGEHGIQVTQGWHSGCYLPEVATDHDMSKEEFLSSCCRDKAGLPADAWKNPETKIMVFTTESFGDD